MVKTGIIAGRLRDKNNKLTQYLSGDRIVYVKGNFSPVLHTFANINNNKCKIWHQSQQMACQRCRRLGHHTSETDNCDAYIEDPEVITIRSPQYVLCNYYPSPLKVFGTEFVTSEHAYQWRFLKHIGEDSLAQEVLESSSPSDAKSVSSRVPHHLHKNWHSVKMCAMKDILHAKAHYCAKFKEELMNSGKNRLVEAVMGDIFWSSGLPPRVADSTKPAFYPGTNQLGHLLESVRFDLMKEAILGKDIHEPPLPSEECIPKDTLSDITSCELNITDSPPPSPGASTSSPKGTTLHLMAVSLPHNVSHPTTIAPPSPSSSSPPQIQSSKSNSYVSVENRIKPTNTNDKQCNRSQEYDGGSSLHHVRDSSKNTGKKNKANYAQRKPSNMTSDVVKGQKTIKAAIEAMKRKLTPEKEADTSRDNQRISRNEHNNT